MGGRQPYAAYAGELFYFFDNSHRLLYNPRFTGRQAKKLRFLIKFLK